MKLTLAKTYILTLLLTGLTGSVGARKIIVEVYLGDKKQDPVYIDMPQYPFKLAGPQPLLHPSDKYYPHAFNLEQQIISAIQKHHWFCRYERLDSQGIVGYEIIFSQSEEEAWQLRLKEIEQNPAKWNEVVPYYVKEQRAYEFIPGDEALKYVSKKDEVIWFHHFFSKIEDAYLKCIDPVRKLKIKVYCTPKKPKEKNNDTASGSTEKVPTDESKESNPASTPTTSSLSSSTSSSTALDLIASEVTQYTTNPISTAEKS